MSMETDSFSSWIVRISLPQPSIRDNTADADRLLRQLAIQCRTDRIACDHRILKHLPTTLRETGYEVTCVLFRRALGWFLVDVVPGKSDNQSFLGLAVDLGTTRVVMRLMDLVSRKVLGETSFDNPQIAVGPDILTRIHYADRKEGKERLQQAVVSAVNHQAALLCRSQGLSHTLVYLMSVAGNTAMTHLFLGLESKWLIREPYTPVTNHPDVVSASEIGVSIHPFGQVFLFPNIGSYFGGDLISGILYSGLHRRDETAVLVDVGTNAEVVLGNRSWMIACAGAAGPALEGGVTHMGMTAGPGVIDRIRIHPKTREIEYHTIGDTAPIGICGSGLIDLAAQLFLSGMIDIRGKFVSNSCKNRLSLQEGLPKLTLVNQSESGTGNDLTITQADLDSLIRSKAAMYTILETITGSVGMTPRDLHTFLIAGTFGYHIDPISAVTIGMIPDLPLSSYRVLGNSSLEGASMVLEYPCWMAEIEEIQKSITYLELNVNADFMNRFSAAKFIPHTHRDLFPSVKPYRPDTSAGSCIHEVKEP